SVRPRGGRRSGRSDHEQNDPERRGAGRRGGPRRRLRRGTGLAAVARAEPRREGVRLRGPQGLAQGADAEVEGHRRRRRLDAGAGSGKELWRKDDYKGSVPGFYAASSPLILDKLCIAQLGTGKSGALVAYELATGKEKWKWTGDGTAYASPAVLTVGDVKAVVVEAANSLVAVGADDGKQLWKAAYKTRYNASSPVIDGD